MKPIRTGEVMTYEESTVGDQYKKYYRLSYGTFWVLVDYKPSRLERIKCWCVGALFCLWPLWLFFAAGLAGMIFL